MMRPKSRPLTEVRYGIRATALSLMAFVTLAPAAQAQGFRSELLGHQSVVEIRIEASSAEMVEILAGIGEIRADLQLGLLFLEESLSHPEGSHFSHPRAKLWPKIKGGVLAAGGEDIEPLLQKLEAAADKDAVMAAYLEVEKALARSRHTLNPTAGDVLLSLLKMSNDAAAEINPAGPTDPFAYQNAWGILMSARGEIDLLMRHEDPAIAQLAQEEAMAFDDLILSMPDPHQPAALEFDIGLIKALIARLEELNEAA
jgi:hypothetical protein